MGLEDFLVNIPHFVRRSLKLNTNDGKVYEEIDELRSEIGGQKYFDTTVEVATSIVLISSTVMGGRKFHLQSLNVNYEAAGNCIVTLGDGDATTTINYKARRNLGPFDKLADRNIKGRIFTKQVEVQVSTQPVWVEIGGVLE